MSRKHQEIDELSLCFAWHHPPSSSLICSMICKWHHISIHRMGMLQWVRMGPCLTCLSLHNVLHFLAYC